MNLRIENVIPNYTVQYIDRDDIWASKGASLYKSKIKEDKFEKIIDLPFSFKDNIFGKSRLLSRAFRLGIKSIIKLQSGTILINAQKKIFRFRDNEIFEVFDFKNGFGPLRHGWCEDNQENCFIGEYFLNNKRNNAINLYKSSDDGLNWEIIESFTNIRHIHSVQFDPFTDFIWLCTGDHDDESRISFSQDYGETWEVIGSGDEMYRTVSLIFDKDKIYWGSDSPTRNNYIYSYNRKNGNIEKLSPVDGPIHYSAKFNQYKLFATVVEGESEGKTLQWDTKSHIWCSKDSKNWYDIASWEKDNLPYILGYGRTIFPAGSRQGKYLYFSTQCLQDIDNSLIKCVIEE